MSDLVSVLFLLLTWEQRQQLRRMLSEEQQHLLAQILNGESNW